VRHISLRDRSCVSVLRVRVSDLWILLLYAKVTQHVSLVDEGNQHMLIAGRRNRLGPLSLVPSFRKRFGQPIYGGPLALGRSDFLLFEGMDKVKGRPFGPPL